MAELVVQHLLALAGVHPLGHVGGHAEPFGNLAPGIEDRNGAREGPAHFAIGPAHAVFQLEGPPLADGVGNRHADLGQVLREKMIVHPAHRRPSTSERSRGPANWRISCPVRAHAEGRIGAGVDERAWTLLAAPKRLLRPLALGDILHHGKHPRWFLADARDEHFQHHLLRLGFRTKRTGSPVVSTRVVIVVPVLHLVGEELADRAAAEIGDAKLIRLHRLVHGDITIVAQPIGADRQPLKDAGALVDGIEQRSILHLAFAQSRYRLLLVPDIAEDDGDLPLLDHADAESMDLVPAPAERIGLMRKTNGLARQRNQRRKCRTRTPRDRAPAPASSVRRPGSAPSVARRQGW